VDRHSDLNFIGGAKITGLPASSAPGEPVIHEQLLAAVEGVAWKDSVRVSTQGNLNLASPGATIDGITMATSDRVLVRAQTAQAQNGIYIWNGAALPMTRALDASTSAELEQAITTVEEGTNTGVSYRQTAVNFTIDSGAVSWTVFGAASGPASESSAGLAEIATQAEADAGTDDARFVTPLKLKTSPFALKFFKANIGDGSATQYDVTHNLNTQDVTVEVIRNSGNFDTVGVDVSRPTVNMVRINFVTAPASNAYRVLITKLA
jgi:hypothetical protein